MVFLFVCLFLSSPLCLVSSSPLLGCFLLLFTSPGEQSKKIAFITSCFSFYFVSLLFLIFDKQLSGFQLLYSAVDLPVFNLNVVLGLDGLGLVFVALTSLIVPLCFLGLWGNEYFQKDFCFALLVLESLLFQGILRIKG
jgi:NADH:ubiquinone oxidoreductase subunit 4 (subunit M)